jgi:hypothetical protein
MSNYGQIYAATKTSRTIGYEESRRKHSMGKLSLRQRFRNWLFEEDRSNGPLPQDISVDDDLLDSERCIKFKVFNASGGRVIETCYYDSQKDRTKRSLYVITNEKDFGHEIDKIITMEHLKQ